MLNMEFIFKLKWLPTVMTATLCVFVFIISSAKSANIMANFYNIESSRLNVPLTYTTLVGISKMDCCVNCLAESTCNSVNYRESPPTQCELISLALNDVDLNRQEASGWAVYSKTDPSHWILLFQGITDIGADPFESWVNGSDVTNDDVRCMRNDVANCPSHFRSDIVEFWPFGNFEVKLSVYKDSSEAGHITFDGTGATMESWFDPARLLRSKWAGLPYMDVFSNYYFAKRRFVVLKGLGGGDGCWIDEAVFMVLTGLPDEPCVYDHHAVYPKYMYSPNGNGLNPMIRDMSLADSLRIAVRIL